MISVILSLPPSSNRIWRVTSLPNGRVLTYKTRDAKQWQEEAAWEIRLSVKKTVFDRARVETAVWWPDGKRRDAHNLEKLLFDALEESGLVDDDQVVVDHRTYVAGIDRERPRLEVQISEV